MATTALAFLAGILSTLSPCVLPLLPIVLGSALSEHRAGPLALAGGLALSFVVIGLVVATVGFAIGLDAGVFRTVAGILLIAIGIVLLMPRLQAQFALAAGPVGNWTEQRFGGFSTAGLGGQFAVGLLLGAVWSPCVGPTLGAASVLASQGKDLGAVAVTMLAFGVGAALPLVLLGLAFARGDAALARAPARRRPAWQARHGRRACRDRAADRHRRRQGDRDRPRRSVAGVVE